MKDEIKELLRILKARSTRYEYCLNANISYSDESYEAHLLYDYITNLQERCEYLERSNNRREDEIMSLRDECVEGETYKSRNEKAIEYLANCDWNCKDFEKLYDILGGDDNE